MPFYRTDNSAQIHEKDGKSQDGNNERSYACSTVWIIYLWPPGPGFPSDSLVLDPRSHNLDDDAVRDIAGRVRRARVSRVGSINNPPLRATIRAAPDQGTRLLGGIGVGVGRLFYTFEGARGGGETDPYEDFNCARCGGPFETSGCQRCCNNRFVFAAPGNRNASTDRNGTIYDDMNKSIYANRSPPM